MASGSWTFSTANKYITGRIRWVSTSNGDLYNSSNVTVYLDYKKSSKSTDNTNGGYSGTLYCGGQSYAVKLSSSTFYLKCNNKWVNMASHTFTMKHNHSGTCAITLGLQDGHCTNGNSLSDPQTSTKAVTLDAITLTAPSVSVSASSVGQTSFVVSWSTNTLYNKVEYNINGGAYKIWSSSTTYKSGTLTFSSLSPGTKYTVNVRITRTDATSKVTTKSVSTATVAIPQVTVSPLKFELESTEPNLNVYVNGLDKGTVKIVSCSFTSDAGTAINLFENITIEQESAATLGGINLDFSDDALLNKIYSNCTNKSEIPLKLNITITGTSNNTYTNNYEVKVTIPTKYKPTFDGFTCRNVDETILQLLGGETNNNYIPQGHGKMQVEISPNKAVGLNYATIVNYKISLRSSSGVLIGSTVTKAYSDTESIIHDIGTTDTPGTYIVEICATDSRGYDSDIRTQEFIVLPYAKPEVGIQDLVLSRKNNFEKELILHLQGSYSSLLIGDTSYNSITVAYKGQNITDSAVVIDETLETSGTLPLKQIIYDNYTIVEYLYNDEYFYKVKSDLRQEIIEIDPAEIWKFVFTITDGLSSISRDATVEQGVPIMAVVDNGMVGINMVPDVEDTTTKLQVNGDISSMKEDGTPVKFLELVEMVENLWQRFYPVGSIYMSVKNTNPSTFIGGTWVAWGAGRVPVGVDTSQTEFATVEKKDGSKTHTLTTAQIPAHTHGSKSLTGRFWNFSGQDDTYTGSANGIFSMTTTDTNAPYPKDKGTVSGAPDTLVIDATHEHTSVGGGQAHNNLQPYITCYMWKRTA